MVYFVSSSFPTSSSLSRLEIAAILPFLPESYYHFVQTMHRHLQAHSLHHHLHFHFHLLLHLIPFITHQLAYLYPPFLKQQSGPVDHIMLVALNAFSVFPAAPL
jgi:hypothetical protein